MNINENGRTKIMAVNYMDNLSGNDGHIIIYIDKYPSTSGKWQVCTFHNVLEKHIKPNYKIIYKARIITKFVIDYIEYLKNLTVEELEKILDLYLKNSSYFPEIFLDKNLRKILL